MTRGLRHATLPPRAGVRLVGHLLRPVFNHVCWPQHGWRVLALLAGFAVLIATASATDRRVAVDPDQPPWTAIVRVQTNIGSRCTGVLIAPATVLTAAHCIYNPRTQAFLQPVSLHVLFGYQRAEYRLLRVIKRFSAGPGFKAGFGPQRDDWARLELSDSVPESIEPLPLADVEPRPGMMVKFAGTTRTGRSFLWPIPPAG